MLQAFVFERVGVVVGDLYFLDPDPHPGQEGPEHGVRLELRMFGRGELKGTIYSATPASRWRGCGRAPGRSSAEQFWISLLPALSVA